MGADGLDLSRPESADRTLVVGVDIGGTFTDCVILASDGRSGVAKVLSTHDDLASGVLASMSAAADGLGLSRSDALQRTQYVAHGSTVGINALLTRTGARVGFLTTAGFEDVLTIARAQKTAGLPEDLLGQGTAWGKPAIPIDRTCIRGITERVDAHGEVLHELK